MSYLFGVSRETILAGGITAAEYAAGWRLLHIRDWRTPSSDIAGTESTPVGGDTDGTGINVNTKYWSFGDSDGSVRNWIVSGDFSGFIWLPEGKNTTARIRFLWGHRTSGRAGLTNGVVWVFGAMQPGVVTGNYIIGTTTQGTLDARVESAALQEPDAKRGYRTDTLDLTLTSWTAEPTMFYFGRDRDNVVATDDMNCPAIVYGIQVLVK